MIILGGNCEPWSAFKQLQVPHLRGPFDWFGIPTRDFPRLLQDPNWVDDSFAPENIFPYDSRSEGHMSVYDLKYQIQAIHHFKINPKNKYYKHSVAEQLPNFKVGQKQRWEALLEAIQKTDPRPCIVYREYNAHWGEPAEESSLRDAYEAIVNFAPNAHLTIVTEKDVVFEGAAVVKQNALEVEYFKADYARWLPAWRFIAEKKDKLEYGKSYGPFIKKETNAQSVVRSQTRQNSSAQPPQHVGSNRNPAARQRSSVPRNS